MLSVSTAPQNWKISSGELKSRAASSPLKPQGRNSTQKLRKAKRSLCKLHKLSANNIINVILPSTASSSFYRWRGPSELPAQLPGALPVAPAPSFLPTSSGSGRLAAQRACPSGCSWISSSPGTAWIILSKIPSRVEWAQFHPAALGLVEAAHQWSG